MKQLSALGRESRMKADQLASKAAALEESLLHNIQVERRERRDS